jgi:hypothetical protein
MVVLYGLTQLSVGEAKRCITLEQRAWRGVAVLILK